MGIESPLQSTKTALPTGTLPPAWVSCPSKMYTSLLELGESAELPENALPVIVHFGFPAPSAFHPAREIAPPESAEFDVNVVFEM
jgi:hypothetical protein